MIYFHSVSLTNLRINFIAIRFTLLINFFSERFCIFSTAVNLVISWYSSHLIWHHDMSIRQARLLSNSQQSRNNKNQLKIVPLFNLVSTSKSNVNDLSLMSCLQGALLHSIFNNNNALNAFLFFRHTLLTLCTC